MKKFWIAFASFFLPFCALTIAEDKQSKDKGALRYDIVVTATRVETPAKEIASPLTISLEEILDMLGKTARKTLDGDQVISPVDFIDAVRTSHHVGKPDVHQ